VKELIRDVLFGAFNLGRCRLSKAKFDIPNSQRAKGGGSKSRSTQLFVFWKKKKNRNEHVIKISEKGQFKLRTRFPKKKGEKLTSRQIL